MKIIVGLVVKCYSVFVILCVFTVPLFAWQPGLSQINATKNFSVDTNSRTDVLSFYNAIYQQSEGYLARGSADWVGGNINSTAPGAEGSVALALTQDTERRINYYRAMVGLNSDVSLNGSETVFIDPSDAHKPNSNITKVEASQRAALMMTKQGSATHTPPNTWFGWTTAAWNACHYGNLAVGFYGPGAIDEYMRENDSTSLSSWTSTAGHRRWLLYSRTQSMASGDIPNIIGNTVGNPTNYLLRSNCLYVVPNSSELGPAISQFILWPNAGYFPDPLIPIQWSISYPEADFSNAVLVVKDENGATVSTTPLSTNNVTQGDNSYVFSISGMPSSVSADTKYYLEMTNITGVGVPTELNYSVTLFDTDSPGAVLSLEGSELPPLAGAEYALPILGEVDAHEFRVGLLQNAVGASPWGDGAEDAANIQVVDGTDSVYPFKLAEAASTGVNGFHLGNTLGQFSGQTIQFSREVVTTSNTQLVFSYRLRRMTPGETVRLQITKDSGMSWTDLWTYTGTTENYNSFVDAPYVTGHSVSVPTSFQNQVVHFRFHVSYDQTVINPGTGSPYPIWSLDDIAFRSGFGIFLDDIAVTEGQWLPSPQVSTLAAEDTEAILDITTAGQALVEGSSYRLQLRTQIGGRWYPYGPPKDVVPTVYGNAYDAWVQTAYSVVGNAPDEDFDGDGIDNIVEYALGTDPTKFQADTSVSSISGNEFRLSDSINMNASGVTVSAECSTDLGTWLPAPIDMSGLDPAILVDMTGKPFCVVRWKVVKNP